MSGENPIEDVVEIKLPSAKKITYGLRRNPWIATTIILGIFVLFMLFNGSSGFGNGSKTIANNLIDFLNSNSDSKVTLSDVSTESGLYKVNVNYQGQIIPLYVTTDGKYLIQTLVPISSSGNSSGNGNSDSKDVGVFLEDTSLYPSLGPSDAETVVIEFSDFQCPFCAMASGLPSWVSTYSSQYGDLIGSAQKIQDMAKQGKLRFVYVSMSFLGQESVYAAEAGLCANEQGKFFEMHDAIFKAHDSKENNGKFNKDKLEVIAKNVAGLDQVKFKSCLEGDNYLSAVQQISSQASNFAQGTPTFYVNGKQVSASWNALQSAIGQ